MEKAIEKPGPGTKEKRMVERDIENSLNRAEKAAKRGDYPEAASVYQEVARLAESINDGRAVDFRIEEANCNLKLGKDFNAGWAYKCAAVYSFTSNDFSNAVNFAAKAIEFFSKADSMYAVQWCYNLIGQAGEKMGDYDIAMKNYRKSLDIEYSEEIEKKIKNLSKLVPTLFVEHKCEKDAVREGEKIDIALTIRNEMKEPVSDIKILGEKSNEVESIPALRPGESKTFKYKLMACENIKPVFYGVTWKDVKGAKREKAIEPPGICVIPNIEVKPYLRDKLEVGKKSFFVVSVANNSKQRIEDIDIELSFPIEFKVYPVTGYSIDGIGPGEEKGFVFKILPTIFGKTILKPAISFRDASGKRYVKNFEPFVLEESLGAPANTQLKTEPEKPVSQKDFDRLKYTEKFKRYLESFMRPKEMEEPGYVKLTRQMHSVTKGYTLKDVDIETVSGHIMEECRSFALVAEHASENYRLLMFSGESKDGAAYLLTVVIKEEDNLVHVAFRLYSDREDELDDVVEKISDIAEYTIIAMSLATEIQKIEVRETINIIDSIVQRSKIGERIRKKDKNVDIKDSILQRTDL
jgi:tetratricopeptide (TPR) repeat protein